MSKYQSATYVAWEITDSADKAAADKAAADKVETDKAAADMATAVFSSGPLGGPS